jgi:hypothetical protein
MWRLLRLQLLLFIHTVCTLIRVWQSPYLPPPPGKPVKWRSSPPTTLCPLHGASPVKVAVRRRVTWDGGLCLIKVIENDTVPVVTAGTHRCASAVDHGLPKSCPRRDGKSDAERLVAPDRPNRSPHVRYFSHSMTL